MTDLGNSTSNVVPLAAERRKRAERRRTVAFVDQMEALAAHIPANVRLPVLVALVVAAEGSGDSRNIEAINRATCTAGIAVVPLGHPSLEVSDHRGLGSRY